jgi:alpha-1,3-rhamnosyl/mannosyltransferase
MTGIGNYSDSLLSALKVNAVPGLIIEEAPVSSVGKGERALHRVHYLLKIRQFLSGIHNQIDAVHFTNVYVPPKRNDVRYIVTIHDLDPLVLSDMHSLPYAVYFRYILHHALQRADLIVTDTESVRNEILERFGLPEINVRYLGVGLSTEFMAAADVTATNATDTPSILFVGQLNKKKNVEWLVEMLAEGRKKDAIPPLRLVLAGSPGFGFEDIERSMRSASPLDVVWVKRPSLAKLAELYRSASAVIVPSLREGFGIPLLEAMYCGCPIIASDIPTNREVAGQAAHFFRLGKEGDLYEAVRSAIRDDGQSERLKSAKERLVQYEWNSIARRCLSFYDDVLKNSHA